MAHIPLLSTGPIRALAALALIMGTPTLKAQTDCDSLDILSVLYAPFSDSALEVTVMNNSQQVLFDYPNFHVVDEVGDTIADETINFFGIGWGAPQVHSLDVSTEVPLPGSVFNGLLVLDYTGFPEPDAPCVYPMSFNLCPDSACMTFQTYLFNMGDALVNATFDWTVTDINGLVRATGTFTLDDNTQEASSVLCLPAGRYHLNVSNPEPTGGQLQFGATRGTFMSDGPQAFYQSGGDPDVLPFDFYLHCAEIGSGIAAVETPGFHTMLDGDRLNVWSANGAALGIVDVLDVNGRLIARSDVRSAHTTIDLHAAAAGTYIVRVATAEGVRSQRFEHVR